MPGAGLHSNVSGRADFPDRELLQSDGFGGLSSLHVFCLGTPRYIFSNTVL